MDGINRNTRFEIGQLVQLFSNLGHQGPQTGVNRRSFPWGPIDGQEEYINWTNNPTFIRVFTADNNSQDLFLVRTEYNDETPIVASPNGNVQRGTIITTPLNGNYTNQHGITDLRWPPVSMVQEYSDDNDFRPIGTYIPNVYVKILQFNGNPLPGPWTTLRNATRTRNIANYLTGLRAQRQGRPGGKDWQKDMRQGLGDEVDELFLAASTPTGYFDGRDVHGREWEHAEDLGGGRRKRQTKHKRNKKKRKSRKYK